MREEYEELFLDVFMFQNIDTILDSNDETEDDDSM